MVTSSQIVELACKEQLDRFFANYPDTLLQKRTAKALRFLAADDQPLKGRPEAWAAGMIYALVNLERQACGVPGLLNSEFEEFFGVTMGTVRKRAANVMQRISV